MVPFVAVMREAISDRATGIVRSLAVVLIITLPGTVRSAEPVKLPGLEIDVEKRTIDVESEVCLDEGALELVACTKGTKEHESIVAVEARPIHIHTALLLLGVEAGNPAMRKAVDENQTRWVDLPPRGGAVEVFLVWKDQKNGLVERPISDFIVHSVEQQKRFPTHTFLFAGSQLHGAGEGPRQYSSDRSGNVISISTFGDETLCLPGVHGHQNGALLWQVDATHLPPVGTKVTLRLRPKRKPPEPVLEK